VVKDDDNLAAGNGKKPSQKRRLARVRPAWIRPPVTGEIIHRPLSRCRVHYARVSAHFQGLGVGHELEIKAGNRTTSIKLGYLTYSEYRFRTTALYRGDTSLRYIHDERIR